MKGDVFIDDWKLQIFTEHLTAAGYTFEKKPGITADTFLLAVPYTDQNHLADVIAAANLAAKKTRMH